MLATRVTCRLGCHTSLLAVMRSPARSEQQSETTELSLCGTFYKCCVHLIRYFAVIMSKNELIAASEKPKQ